MSLTIKKPSRRNSDAKQAAIDEATREETTRLNILIPKSLHRRLRLQAVQEGHGVTMTSIVIRAGEDYLAKYSDEDQ